MTITAIAKKHQLIIKEINAMFLSLNNLDLLSKIIQKKLLKKIHFWN